VTRSSSPGKRTTGSNPPLSSSANATYAVVAASTPMVRANAPRFRRSGITCTSGSADRTASTVPSVEPLSTRITGASCRAASRAGPPAGCATRPPPRPSPDAPPGGGPRLRSAVRRRRPRIDRRRHRPPLGHQRPHLNPRRRPSPRPVQRHQPTTGLRRRPPPLGDHLRPAVHGVHERAQRQDRRLPGRRDQRPDAVRRLRPAVPENHCHADPPVHHPLVPANRAGSQQAAEAWLTRRACRAPAGHTCAACSRRFR